MTDDCYLSITLALTLTLALSIDGDVMALVESEYTN